MRALDYIETARDLTALSTRGRPRLIVLRRAVSTTYYALFHCLAACCADMLVGGASANRSKPAWRQAYRALQHGAARKRCMQGHITTRFPSEIQDFAALFVDVQKKRHSADYDPDADFFKFEVIQRIDEAEKAIRQLQKVPAKDRRAFAVLLLFDIRR